MVDVPHLRHLSLAAALAIKSLYQWMLTCDEINYYTKQASSEEIAYNHLLKQVFATDVLSLRRLSQSSIHAPYMISVSSLIVSLRSSSPPSHNPSLDSNSVRIILGVTTSGLEVDKIEVMYFLNFFSLGSFMAPTREKGKYN